MTLISSRTIRGRCPTCGAQHAACGTPSESVPVDEQMEVAVMGGSLQRYTVSTPSGVETVLKLHAEEAERLGATPLAGAPTETETPDPDTAVKTTTSVPAKKRTTTSNKARAAADKDGGAGGGDD